MMYYVNLGRHSSTIWRMFPSWDKALDYACRESLGSPFEIREGKTFDPRWAGEVEEKRKKNLFGVCV